MRARLSFRCRRLRSERHPRLLNLILGEGRGESTASCQPRKRCAVGLLLLSRASSFGLLLSLASARSSCLCCPSRFSFGTFILQRELLLRHLLPQFVHRLFDDGSG